MRKKANISSADSAEGKQRQAIGAQIAACLPQLNTVADTAQALGISKQSVLRIERRALYKIRQQLLEMARA